jgi:hypothetical protein
MAQYVLEILDGDRAGEVVTLSEQPLRIGRKPGNDLVLNDEKTSGVHAEVVFEGNRHVLRDLGSTNGTHLDGRRVTEVVLSPGDVVAIGRLRVHFRDASAPAAATAGAEPGFGEVRRLDTARVAGRSGGMLALAGVVLVGLGAGGYLWWSSRGDEVGPAHGPRHQEPLTVAGNKLPAAVANCEVVEGWRLQAAGTGFDLGGRGHTGRGCLEAVRGEGVAADYGVATLAEPLAVLSNRSLVLSVRLRTDQGGEGAVRAVFFAQNEQMPFRFRSGSPLQAYDGWTEVTVALAVPPGCDRMQIELLAVLPQVGAAVLCDDLAVLEQGDSRPIELRIEQSKQVAIGTGTALAVRSTDAENPVVLYELLPAQVRPALASLQRDGWLSLSDVGAKLTCTAGERSLQVAAEGPAALQWVLPAEAARGLRLCAAAAAPFAPLGAEAAGEGVAVLFGDRATRAMLVLPQPQPVRGALANGLHRLEIGGNRAELVLGFAAEREQGAAALQKARDSVAGARWGEALDHLHHLQSHLPHDSEVLAQALALRDQVLAGQADELKRLQADLADASFYDTRGGFERVLAGVAALKQAYGERNLADAEACAALETQAGQRLAALVHDAEEQQVQRLDQLAKVLEPAQPGLSRIVASYLARRRAAAGSSAK